MEFNNLKQLEKYINSQIKESMDTEVNETVRRRLKENVIEEAYDKYEPTQYERTGGLYQDRNIESDIVDTSEGVELSVRSTREEDGRDIAQIIESGKGYSWKNSRIAKSGQARPFHEKTHEDLERSGEHIEAMKRGLKQQGLDVE
jgi:hypothetical protein